MIASVFVRLTMNALGTLTSAAPRLVEMSIAGVLAAVVTAALLRLTARRSFATRAIALHLLTVLLLVVTTTRFIASVTPSAGPATAEAPDGTSWLRGPRIAVPVSVSVNRALVELQVSAWTQMAAGLVVFVWLAGAVGMIGRVVAGAWRLRAIRRRARPSGTCRGGTPVLVSDEIDIPFVSGVRRPAILVPTSSESWTPAEWRLVLLHEGSHVARGDVAMQWVRQVTLSVHWFNPAVHWLVRQADEACENACDDAVLSQGADVTRYAHTLLDFAGQRWSFPSAPSPTIVGRSGIERRLRAMTEVGRRRRATMRADRIAPCVAGVLGGLLLTVLWPRLATSLPLTRQVEFPVPVPNALMTGAGSGAAAPAVARRSPIAMQSGTFMRRSADDTTAALVGLGAALHDVNPIVRDAATRALGRWRSTATLARLQLVAQHGAPESRAAARAALSAMEDSR